MNRWWLTVAIVCGALVLWESAVRLTGVASYILPAPSSIAVRTCMSWRTLLDNALVTMQEAVFGLVMATVLGIMTALLFQMFPRLDEAGQPIIAGIQSFPKEAIAPLLVVWFGFGMASKLVISCSIAFFPVFLSTLKGLKAVPDEVVTTFQSLRAAPRDILLKARLPYSLPYMFSGIRVASTLSIVGAVIGEFVGSSAGLGHLILVSNAQFSVDLVFGCLIILAVMGVGLDLCILRLERGIIPWHESMH